jgi:hypothetical protein
MQVHNSNAVLTISPTSADSSLDSSKGSSFEYSKMRYTINSTPSFSMGVVLSCLATKVYDILKVFEVITT